MILIVALEGDGETYWDEFHHFIEASLLKRGWISPEDTGLYYRARTPREAAGHIIRFYRHYHSSRYVRDDLIIRLNHRLRDEQVEALNDDFAPLVKSGRIAQCSAYPEERDHLDLPRIAFTHTRNQFALVRKLIERINECDECVAG